MESGGFPVEHPEVAILKYEGYMIPSSMVLKKPFTVKINTDNFTDDKEAERVSKIILKMLNIEEV